MTEYFISYLFRVVVVASEKDVIELTDSNFEEKVLKSWRALAGRVLCSLVGFL